MNKILKYTLWGAGGLAGVLVLGAGILAATFDPNDYKPLIVDLVKQQKQRTLNIEGDIKLAFWPKLGADLGRVRLSEHAGQAEFASIESAKLFVAVLPLLKKELVVDTVRVDGVKANIVRFKDGSTNFDDLLSKEEESEEIKFDIDGVQIRDASIALTDEMTARRFQLERLQLTTGRIVKNKPIDLDGDFHIRGNNPVLDADVTLTGTVLADTEAKRYGANDLDLTLRGDVATLKGADLRLAGDIDAQPERMEFAVNGLKFALKATLDGRATELELAAPRLTALEDEVSGDEATLKLSQSQGEDRFSANLVIADLKGSPRAFQSSGIRGELSGKQGARSLQGKFSSPFAGNLEALVFDLPKLAGSLDVKDPALPSGAMTASFDVNAHADLKQEQARVALAALIDGSKLNGKLVLAGFARPAVEFDLVADQLDLNKILGQPKPAAQKSAGTPAKPADLAALKNLTARGALKVGSVRYQQYQVSKLALQLKADGQTLDINPLSARLDDSQIKGRVGIRNFDKPLYVFDLDIDRINADRYLASGGDAKPAAAAGPAKPLDLSALEALNAEGELRIGSLKYGEVQGSNIRLKLKADGEKLGLDPFSAKIDDSQVKAAVGITRFRDPQFSFDLDIDKLDADRYVTKSAPAAKGAAAQPAADTPLDLSALKTLNARGEARVGWLKLSNVKTSQVRLGLNATGGLLELAPFSANLYQGSTSGVLQVDARATPAIALRQEMKGINIGPLLVDAINNDMLEGKGNLSVDVKTQGATVGALKKALAGNAAVNLADGAIKGFNLAGTLRKARTQLSALQGQTISASDQEKTDFSEMKATFKIAHGVARNDDLDIKSPLFRIGGSGDIDIGNEKLNYLAKPTVVASLKGQGGDDLSALKGITIPVRVAGTFASPKFSPDFAALGTALAQQKLLEKVGGDKAAPLQQILEGDKAGALETLIGGKKKAMDVKQEDAAPAPAPDQPAPAKPESTEEQLKKGLDKLFGR